MKLKGFLCLLLMLLTFLAPAMAHADPDRVAGVHAGMFATYDHEAYGTRSTANLLVTGVNNSTILFNMTDITVSMTWTNVNGAILILTSPTGGTSYDATKVGMPHFFIGAGLIGGPEYRGSDVTMKQSFFGKIILGNWRFTNYVSLSLGGYTQYLEWDQNTGLLTKFTIDYNGAGNHYTLTNTNAWTTHIPLWDTLYNIRNVLDMVLTITMPVVGSFLLFYLLSFMFIGMADYFRVKKSRGIKQSIVPPWLKMILITALIFIGLWIVILYFVFPLIFGAISGR